MDSALRSAQFWFVGVAAILVPLIVLPDSAFLDITSTSKVTTTRFIGSLLAAVLLSRAVIRLLADSTWAASAWVRLKSNRAEFYVLISIGLVALVSILSTLLSIAPGISIWGRNPAGFESGEYTALMYVVFAVGIYVTVREQKTLERLWLVLATTGAIAALIGVFQYHGFSFLDISQVHRFRVTGTAGNPNFFAAILILLAPVSITYLVYRSEQALDVMRRRYWLFGLVLVTGAYSLSMVASVARGPLVGWMVGFAVLGVLVLRYGRGRQFKLPLLLVLASVVFFGGITTVYDPVRETTKIETTDAGLESTTSLTSESPTEKFEKVTGGSTVRIRLQYWKLSQQVAMNRPTIPFTNDAPAALRWLVGYGPDSFRYVATSNADTISFTGRFTAAHNDPINRWVEQGFLGLVAWLLLWGAIGFALWRLVVQSANQASGRNFWLSIGLASAFGSRFVEQLAGSPTTGDVFLFWVLVGLTAGMIAKVEISSGDKGATKSLQDSSTRAARLSVFVMPSVAIILLLGVLMSWESAGRFFFANNAGAVLRGGGEVTFEDADNRFASANRLAPEVTRYWRERADLEHGRAVSASNPVTEREARELAYEYDNNAFDANPLEINSHYRLAFSAWELGKLGDNEKRLEALELYERLVQIAPADALAAERLITLRGAINR